MKRGWGEWGRGTLCRAVMRLPVRHVARLAGLRVLTPLYHVVSDDPPPYLLPPPYDFPDVREFERGLDAILADFRPMPLGELLLALKEGGPWPERSFLLTIDDGHRESVEVMAPLLLRKGIPATFFLCSGFLDNPRLSVEHKAGLILHRVTMAEGTERDEFLRILDALGLAPFVVRAGMHDVEPAIDAAGRRMGLDWNQARRRYEPYLTTPQVQRLLADGFTIGAHSVDHPLYRDLPLEEQLRQTKESTDAICSQFGISYRAFAFPYNEDGVGRAFFETVAARRVADVLFGTRGLIEDEFRSMCVHRLWFEDIRDPVATHMRRHIADKFIRRMTGKDVVRRPG